MNNKAQYAAPVAEALGLEAVIKALADDLQKLRDGKISPQDALARAALAKQLFNGARMYLQAMRTIEDRSRPVNPAVSSDPSGPAK